MFAAIGLKIVTDTIWAANWLPSLELPEAIKTKPLGIAVKQYKRRWFFCHTEQYTMTDFKLSDIIKEGGNTIQYADLVDDDKELGTYCKTYLLSNPFGSDLKNVFSEFYVNASCAKQVTVDLKDLKSSSVKPKVLRFKLIGKKVNMDHILVQQTRKNKNEVLCIVMRVIKTSDHGKITYSSEETQEKATICEFTDGKDIILTANTVVAYIVWELTFNTDNGEIESCLPGKEEWNYSEDCPTSNAMLSNLEYFEICVKHLDDQLKPLLKSTETEMKSLRSILRQLLKYPTDAVILSQLLERAERGNLKENIDKLNEHIVDKDNTWKVAFRAGVHHKGENVVYEEKPTLILSAFTCLIDAMCDVKAQDLVKISECTDEQLKALTTVLKYAIIGDTDTCIKANSFPALEKPAKDLLTSLGLGLNDDGYVIGAIRRSRTQECIFCIIYLFSNMSVSP